MENNKKILWLYSDLLDLYGDWGNILLIEKRLKEMGISYEVEHATLGDTLDLEGADMIYIGPGKARNLKAAAQHLIAYKEAFQKAVADGKVMLVTGNARLLLGESFTDEEGNRVEGLNVFPYTGKETGKVFVSDVVATPVAGKPEKCYGFINRTSTIQGNVGPYLFQLEQGAGDEDQGCKQEGNLQNNLFSTWCLGPVLVKNPPLARQVLTRLCGEAMKEYDDSLEKKARELTLKDMQPQG